MKSDQWVSRGLPLVLMAMIGVVVWLNAWHRDGAPLVATCANLAAGCVVQVERRDVSLGTDGAIKPLKPFNLWVRAPGAKKVEARFTMEGMDMGFNIYALRADSQGVYRASATLPVCVSGRRDWAMILDIDGTRFSVPFVTDL
jgi:hypothetical protein